MAESASQTKPFGSLVAWMGGATTLIVAVGSLMSAYDKLPSFNLRPLAGNPTTYEKPHGYLRKDGAAWQETDAKGVMFTFKEISRSDGITTVLDETRDCYLKWPNQGGQVEVSIGIPMKWRDLYIVTVVQG